MRGLVMRGGTYERDTHDGKQGKEGMCVDQLSDTG